MAFDCVFRNKNQFIVMLKYYHSNIFIQRGYLNGNIQRLLYCINNSMKRNRQVDYEGLQNLVEFQIKKMVSKAY